MRARLGSLPIATGSPFRTRRRRGETPGVHRTCRSVKRPLTRRIRAVGPRRSRSRRRLRRWASAGFGPDRCGRRPPFTERGAPDAVDGGFGVGAQHRCVTHASTGANAGSGTYESDAPPRAAPQARRPTARAAQRGATGARCAVGQSAARIASNPAGRVRPSGSRAGREGGSGTAPTKRLPWEASLRGEQVNGQRGVAAGAAASAGLRAGPAGRQSPRHDAPEITRRVASERQWAFAGYDQADNRSERRSRGGGGSRPAPILLRAELIQVREDARKSGGIAGSRSEILACCSKQRGG